MVSTDTRNQWLDQLRDDPSKYLAVDIPSSTYTVNAVPDLLRAMSPEYYERTELQLGLHNRTHQSAGTQQLKVDIAGSLHTRLLKSNSSWEDFANAVVGDAASARAHYENGAAGDDAVPDEAVPYMLAMDALFFVVFFQYLNAEFFFFDEFQHLGERLKDTARTLSKSDLFLVENQVPMYLLKSVLREFIILKKKEGVLKNESVTDELFILQKVAVIHLYPVGQPDNFNDYLNEKYKGDLKCKHILDCVYIVLCGHTKGPPPRSTGLKLGSIPSATRLQAIGISVTDTASTLDRIRLYGSGYVRNACLGLPRVDVYDNTEMVFHNLALHEQLVDGGRWGDFRCFLQCMASLSNDTADVRLLVDHGVVDNKLGSNLVGMWERVMKGVNTPSPSDSWENLYKAIYRHRKSRVKTWRREIWVLFFSKPWTFVSLVGAIIVLFLTGVQTWFTVVNSSHRGWRWPS